MLLKENKKGVSVMIGYVLLVVIAIGLSIAVFAYLQLYLPSDQPECYSDVTLTIEMLECGNGHVNVSVKNRGTFNVDGVFIRIGSVDRVFKELLNEKDAFLFVNDANGDKVLNPGEEWSDSYVETDYPGTDFIGIQELEIEPFLYFDNQPVLCEHAVVSRRISC